LGRRVVVTGIGLICGVGNTAPEVWKKIDNHDLGTKRSGWDGMYYQLMTPELAGLVEYATGADAKLLELKKAAKDPEDLAELLTMLRPIARGTQAEVQLIEEAMKTPSPAVQRAAVAAAGAAAQRRNDVYTETLTTALLSPDSELRLTQIFQPRSD